MKPQQAAKIREQQGIDETKLQKLRVKKGLSQNDLANFSGVPKRVIESYEQRARRIDGCKLETLCKLCLTLECKIEDIIEDNSVIDLLKKVK